MTSISVGIIRVERIARKMKIAAAELELGERVTDETVEKDIRQRHGQSRSASRIPEPAA
jgi:hypothetical protein